MLNQIFDIIYPNKCEIVKTPNGYVYPIYKNGSGSINEYALEQKYKILFNEQIKRAQLIHVILRDSESRFLSGINTYVYNTYRDNENLDLATVLFFAENYLFLNRHYSPQLSWLLHLSKYLDNNTKLKLLGMESLSMFTPMNIRPIEGEVLTDKDVNRIRPKLIPYVELDNILLELIGQELTFKEILSYIKMKNSNAYAKLKCTVLD
jgi:hypothetical protein